MYGILSFLTRINNCYFLVVAPSTKLFIFSKMPQTLYHSIICDTR